MSEIYSRQPQACECHAISQQSYHRAKRHLRPTRGQKGRRGKREGAGESETDKSNGRMPSSKQKSNNNKILYCSVNNSIVSLNSTRQRQTEKTETGAWREWEKQLELPADKDRKYAQMKREIKNKLPQNNIK